MLHRPRPWRISTASQGSGPEDTGPAGEWCNGNTPVFGTVILGSSPSSPATFFFLHIFQNIKKNSLLWAVVDTYGDTYGQAEGASKSP